MNTTDTQAGLAHRGRVHRTARHGPEPWVPGRKEHLLKIPLKLVSGRRIVPGESDGGTFERLSEDSALAGAVGER